MRLCWMQRLPSVVLKLLLCLCHVSRISSERIMGQENGEFDFDGLPGAQHDFKVFVPGYTEDCFFQPVASGAKLHVNYEVLKVERYIDFYVRDPQWQIIESQIYKKTGQYSLDNAAPGTYAICINNAHTRFETTLVYLYIVTFVMHEWIEFQKEFTEIQVLASNFTHSLTGVQEMVSSMRNSQAKARFNVVRDWYLVNGNNEYIFRWSLAQCVLIVAAALVQVYSVRRLFRTTNVTPTTAKPRA